MSQDGKPQLVPKPLKNDRPIRKEVPCPCGGKVYRSGSGQFARCSNGEIRCTRCLREARRFGRSGLTCGTNCVPVQFTKAGKPWMEASGQLG